MLESKPGSGAAGAALHFVEHEQPVVLVADRAQPRQVIRMADVDAAFTLDQLHQHGDDIAVACGHAAHRFEVVERNSDEAREEQRLETRLRFAAAGRRERRDRASVERFIHDDDRGGLDAFLMPVKARELDRRLVRLASGIAEENTFHAGDRGKAIGELLLQRDLVDVRRVDEHAHLLAQHGGEARMRVTEAAHRNASERVEIALALGIPQPRAFTALESDGKAGVSVHHVRHGTNPEKSTAACAAVRSAYSSPSPPLTQPRDCGEAKRRAMPLP